jgi:ABC-type nitrate/sulfonate/bicarbonate transport system permease component
MFAAVAAIVALAYLADRITVAVSNRLLRWDDIENRLG